MTLKTKSCLRMYFICDLNSSSSKLVLLQLFAKYFSFIANMFCNFKFSHDFFSVQLYIHPDCLQIWTTRSAIGRLFSRFSWYSNIFSWIFRQCFCLDSLLWDWASGYTGVYSIQKTVYSIARLANPYSLTRPKYLMN